MKIFLKILNCSIFSRVKPSKEMQAALKVINDSLLKGQHLATTLKNANKIVQKEWFRISSTENAQPFEVEDYLDCFEELSPNLLKYIVNLTDANVRKFFNCFINFSRHLSFLNERAFQ